LVSSGAVTVNVTGAPARAKSVPPTVAVPLPPLNAAVVVGVGGGAACAAGTAKAHSAAIATMVVVGRRVRRRSADQLMVLPRPGVPGVGIPGNFPDRTDCPVRTT
jgi:hypothetical protein